MRAIISVTDKSGVVELARGLTERGVGIVSTGGTAAKIKEAGLPVLLAEHVTGFPEMMQGRLKTLHPLIMGGILARRAPHPDAAQAEAHGISMVDIVVVNLYDFSSVAAKDGVTFGELIEHVDIGGPSMIRAAAKNCDHVTVITDPKDYHLLLQEMDLDTGISRRFRREMMAKAFRYTSDYDDEIALTMEDFASGDEE